MSDHDAMRWAHAAQVCAEAAATREEVEKRTVFDDLDEPVELVVLGPPLVVERDGSVAIACNVILHDGMKARVVEFTAAEWGVIDYCRRIGAPLLKMWWAVCRKDGTSVVMRRYRCWTERKAIEESATIDLEAMYGNAALDGR